MLELPVDVLVVATKAPALDAALRRVRVRAGARRAAAQRGRAPRPRCASASATRRSPGSIRIGAERVAPGRIVHSSPAFRIELAPPRDDVGAFVHVLRAAEIPAKLLDREADVLWSKLVRLNALACTTAAADMPIGEVRAHPVWRMRLEGAVTETAAVAPRRGRRGRRRRRRSPS